jgi:hypothetical protein
MFDPFFQNGFSELVSRRLVFRPIDLVSLFGVSRRTVWYLAKQESMPLPLRELTTGKEHPLRVAYRPELIAWCAQVGDRYAAAGLLLARTELALPLTLRAGVTAKALGVSTWAVANSLVAAGLPVRRTSHGRRPYVSRAELEAWIVSRPAYRPAEGDGSPAAKTRRVVLA